MKRTRFDHDPVDFHIRNLNFKTLNILQVNAMNRLKQLQGSMMQEDAEKDQLQDETLLNQRVVAFLAGAGGFITREVLQREHV